MPLTVNWASTSSSPCSLTSALPATLNGAAFQGMLRSYENIKFNKWHSNCKINPQEMPQCGNCPMLLFCALAPFFGE